MNRRTAHERALLWVAQGFGVGWIPVAPGTFGSVLGFGWLALLLLPRDGWFLVLGSLAGFAVAVWLCGRAEKCLGEKDPGSVVLDEVIAVPICFWAWAGLLALHHNSLPGPAELFSSNNMRLLLGIFLAFRFFDVLKPWPVGQSQKLPGGWGVVVDDVLAAGYVNLAFLLLKAAGWV